MMAAEPKPQRPFGLLSVGWLASYINYVNYENYLGDRNRPEVSDDFTVRMASMVIHFIPLSVIAPEGRTL